MLFDTPSYFNHSFPAPQYLGAKHTHLAWINKFIPSRITTALDAFAGSQSMAFLFKQLGFKTITNDFLNFNHQIGLALIQNNNIQLSNDDVNLLFSPAINKTDFQLIENLFTKRGMKVEALVDFGSVFLTIRNMLRFSLALMTKRKAG